MATKKRPARKKTTRGQRAASRSLGKPAAKSSQSTKSKKMTRSSVRLFRDIKKLHTLAGVALKGGRHTQAEDLTSISDAAVIEKNGRILWVGPRKLLPRDLLREHSVEEVSLERAEVMPALVEPHTHLIFAGNRAGEFERRNQGESYQSISRSGGGILSTVRQTREVPEKTLVELGQARLNRFLAQGVATVEVKSGYALSLEGELKMLKATGKLRGARVVRTFLGAHAIAPEFGSAEEYVRFLINEALPEVKRTGLASRVDVFVEDGYFSAELAESYLRAAKELGFDLVVHADQLTRSGGAELAVRLGARSAEHLIRVNESDIGRLAKSEVVCVLLPSADLYMNCPYPPARQLIDQGACVSLSTDYNPGSSPSQDVTLVGVLARLQMRMTLAEVVAAYTYGGARALGLESEIGSLEVGKSCDLCVLAGNLEEVFFEVGHSPAAQLYVTGRLSQSWGV